MSHWCLARYLLNFVPRTALRVDIFLLDTREDRSWGPGMFCDRDKFSLPPPPPPLLPNLFRERFDFSVPFLVTYVHG
jgi:hypothetical protein